MFKKLFALAFASAISSLAFASEPAPAVQAPTTPVAQVNATVGDVPEPDQLKAKNAKECASECRQAHCSGSQFISNGNGGGSCTCSGCSY